MADVNSITVSTKGFQTENPAEEDMGKKVYYINDFDDLSINFFNLPPDITAVDETEKAIQDNNRKIAFESGGAMIETKKMKLGNLEAIKAIFKFPMQPSGMVYLGSYTIPFKNMSYVIKIQAPEVGMTGVRDSTICGALMNEGIIKFEDDEMKGWMKDPYDETINLPFMMNLSEKESFDEMFPDHPLSRLRVQMRNIEKTVKYDPSLECEEKFTYGVNK